MLLLSYSPVTSCLRQKKTAFIWHPKSRTAVNFLKYKTHHKKPTNQQFINSGVRRLYKTQLWQLYIVKPSVLSFIAVEYAFSTRPLREFFLGKTMFGFFKLFPFTEGVYPGFRLWGTTMNLFRMPSLHSQFLTLENVPLNSIISFVYNYNNERMTFAKSSGCNAYRRRDIRKTKLLYVQLPSGKLIVLSPKVYCIMSPNLDLQLNKVVDGKWGSFKRSYKRISVRGVAKNPVDHPNGGRTKAKQPELSPWGWVAKLNK